MYIIMIIIMKILIIDAANEKILLSLILNKNIYTGTYINSKKNYDKLTILISKFLLKYKTNLDKMDCPYLKNKVSRWYFLNNMRK